MSPGLSLTVDLYEEMVAHCLRGYPLEACGLLAGDPDTGRVLTCHPTDNAAGSSRIYTVDPLQHLKADRAAEEAGQALIGVFHSHTHTKAYPSPTDIGQAPDPQWHYVLVSLRHSAPEVRSYRIAGGEVTEEPVTLEA